jgi:hypothetical protein
MTNGVLLQRRDVSSCVAASGMGQADTRILARYQDLVADLRADAAHRMDQLLGREGRA